MSPGSSRVVEAYSSISAGPSIRLPASSAGRQKVGVWRKRLSFLSVQASPSRMGLDLWREQHTSGKVGGPERLTAEPLNPFVAPEAELCMQVTVCLILPI